MPSRVDDPNRIINAAEAAVTLEVSKRTIIRKIHSGTLARHRTNTPTHDGPPAWLQLVSTIAAVAAGWFAILEWRDPAAPLLMGVALLIAGAALAVDVTAAVQARRDTAGGE
jgi:hypothetical protein